MRFDGMRLRAAALALAAALVQGCGEGGDGGVGGDGLVSGTGGSTARMTIVDDRLYAIAGDAVQLFDLTEVCDGADGLKTFDLSDGDLPRLIDTLPDVRCHDLIARDDLLYVVSERGLTQYDLTTGRPLELSVIERAPVVYVVDR